MFTYQLSGNSMPEGGVGKEPDTSQLCSLGRLFNLSVLPLPLEAPCFHFARALHIGWSCHHTSTGIILVEELG